MKKGIAYVLLLAMLLPLFCCALPENEVRISLTYRMNPHETSVGSIFRTYEYRTENADVQTLAQQVVEELRHPPDAGYLSPFPAGIIPMSVKVEGDAAAVDLSESFQDLKSIEQSVVVTCIVCSLCAVDGIHYVRITAGGQQISGRRDRYLSREDFVLSSAVLGETHYETVIYAPDESGEKLAPQQVTLTSVDGSAVEMELVGAVLSAISDGKAADMLPENFAVRSAEMQSDVCYLNLTREIETMPEEEAALLLHAFADSLCTLRYIQSVQFMVEGENRAKIGGVDTANPVNFGEDTAFVQRT